MATTVESLLSKLRGIIGDEDSSNQRFTDANLRDVKFENGLDILRGASWPQIYDITGSGSSKEFDPDPSTNARQDIDAILLATALAVLDGEIQKNANVAVVVSNPAGRTDLTQVAELLMEQKDRLEKRLEALGLDRSNESAIGDMSAKEISASDTATSPEGLPRITIIHENR